ncbi:MAG: hypothetical protein KJ077_32785 [Anaerolineae bacterium]|nr:hypothetical protein [Anaerolineae bacterium]
MTTAVLHSTRIAVQIVVDDDTDSIAALILAITALINLLLQLGHFVSKVVVLITDFVEAAQFTAAVFTIGFRSLAWGVGMKV